MSYTNNYDSSFYIIKRLFVNYTKPVFPQLLIAMLCMFIVAGTTAASAWLIQPALDNIFVKKQMNMLFLIPSAILLNAIISAVASFYESIIMKKVGQQIVARIQLELYNHLIYADLKFLIKHPTGSIISRFTNDINTIKVASSEILTSIMEQFFTLIALIIIMFYQNFYLALITIIIIPIAFYPIIKLGRKMRWITSIMQEKLGEFTTRLEETFSNIRVIKSYCAEKYEVSRVKELLEKFLAIYRKAIYIESISSPLMEMLGGVAVAGIVLYGGFYAIHNETTPGSFLSFITALLLSYKPLKAISKFNTVMQEGLSAAKRLFSFLDVKPEIKFDKTQTVKELKEFDITFNNVSFAYKHKSKTKILQNFQIDIKQGQTVAFVGGSGAGKSTVLNLLQRLYDPDLGEITIGDVNIKDIQLPILRKNISLVNQDVTLFDNTIKDNIRYGNFDASDEQILDASMAAAAHDFIMGFPKNYSTRVGQNGVKLSGGQKQRIAIARAILKNAPILLLDEATSALDSISEKKVQIALEYLKRGRTTIIIAHRLSTIEAADMIFVLSDGKAIEKGTHAELLKKKGEYSKLYQQYKIGKVPIN